MSCGSSVYYLKLYILYMYKFLSGVIFKVFELAGHPQKNLLLKLWLTSIGEQGTLERLHLALARDDGML